MPDAWLPGAERVRNDKSGGGSYDGSPYRFVIHTTEGIPNSIVGCRTMAANHATPPQLWYHPQLRWLGQTVPLDRSGFALGHPKGTPETNRAGAIQVEVFAYARDTPSWTTELDNLGHDVLGAILRAGWPIDTGRVALTTGADGYGLNGAVRMTWDHWRTFSGVCCHSNVPGNAHWDAGKIDLERIVRAATGATPSPTPLPKDDDMPYLLVAPQSGGRWWITDLRTNSRPCDSLDDAINTDYLLRELGKVAPLVCNRDASGAVAGPIAINDAYLAEVTAYAAGGDA